MNMELGYTGLLIAFDLDDTLFSEIEFVKSGYKAVAKMSLSYLKEPVSADFLFKKMLECYHSGNNAFDWLASQINSETEPFISKCVDTYRYHTPKITLQSGVMRILETFRRAGVRMALITDGRSRTQRLKLSALGIEHFFPPDNILISEEYGSDKTSIYPWQTLVRKYPNARKFIYVGDNPAKDFTMPDKLGWLTIGVRDAGENIHSQSSTSDTNNNPQIWINNISELLHVLT
ncbi:MAG: HAD-IA family hydrolase [Prevotella sp.]|nr:HAD-IA family hydrolase [Prevotella sp.]MCM1074712.1 HAD-IA family hydrolase [Ruminococcus sp.]